jgi:hypothetical protein
VTRRTLALVVVLVLAVAGTAGGWLALRSSGGVTGLCTSQPTGFKERSIPKTGVSEATVVLTNFRFGRMDDLLWARQPSALAASRCDDRRQ